MSKQITFPATFICLPYAVDQNEPSTPHRKLIKAEDEKDLEAKAKTIWLDTFGHDVTLEENLELVRSRANGFGDYEIEDCDLCVFLTKLDD